MKICKISERSQAVAEHFQQSAFWVDFKSCATWQATNFSLEIGGKLREISILTRQFGKFFSLCYCPMPLAHSDFSDDGEYFAFLQDFADEARAFLPRNSVFLRIDVDSPRQSTSSFALRKSAVDVQPPDTVLLDLTRSEDEMLAAMKPKWRYNVRLAEKKGVVVQKRGIDALDDFYRLFEITAKRDGIAVHERRYYETLFEVAKRHGAADVSIYLATHGGKPLAAIVTLFLGDEAVYLYGASSNEKRNLMPAYLLQWRAICDAKKFGCKIYDFYGIPPTDDEKHPMHGLYRFKTGFGGQIVHRAGSFDVPFSSLYKFYSVAEIIRAFYFKKIRKIFRTK